MAISAAVKGEISPRLLTTIRQQNNDFRFRLAILQTGNRIGNTHTDGRTIFNQSALGDIAFDAVEQIQQHPMVYRQRTLGKTLASKEGQTDIVIRAAVNKLGRYILRRFNRLGFKSSAAYW